MPQAIAAGGLPAGDFEIASTKTSHRGRLKLARLGPKGRNDLAPLFVRKSKTHQFIDEDGPLRFPIRCRARTPLRIPNSPTTSKRPLQPSTARDRRNSSAGSSHRRRRETDILFCRKTLATHDERARSATGLRKLSVTRSVTNGTFSRTRAEGQRCVLSSP